MKKLILLISLSLIILTETFSQQCLPDGLTFSTQTEIDNFQVNYPGCTEIEGNVTISGDDITSLTGLSILTSIGGELKIFNNQTLTSLTGLDNLTYIDGCLHIGDIPLGNPLLINLSGLNNLDTIGGDLTITFNHNLTNLTGLNNLLFIGGNLYVIINESLFDFTGVDNLSHIENEIEISLNNSLNSLNGLDSLSYVGSSFYIWDNPSLSSLSNLHNLEQVYFLDISYNESLVDLSGLNNLVSIEYGLIINNNDALVSLNGLENIITIGNLAIGDNSYGGNASLVSLSGLENLASISGDLLIGGNISLNNLDELSNLTNIEGSLYINKNYSLNNLNGISSINSESIEYLSITNNTTLTDCNVQSICNYLADPAGAVSIYNNMVGCNNPAEIASGCGFTIGCLPYGHYYFYSQSEVDNFQNNYPNCTDIKGSVFIKGSDIIDLSGLSTMSSVENRLLIGDLYNYNSKLTNLSGLEGLDSIGGSLHIWSNDSLNDISALSNLTYVGEDLRIMHNPFLHSLAGLDNIDAESINFLSLNNNSSLRTCEVKSICNYLAIPSASTIIMDNVTGCNSREEVEYDCAVWTLETKPNSPFTIYPNPSNGKITISTNDCASIDEIIIYNQLGQKVFHRCNMTDNIDISSLGQGMYIIELAVEKINYRQKLIIK